LQRNSVIKSPITLF